MSGQTQHSPVKTSNLTDKCPMTGANLQACCWFFKVRIKIQMESRSQKYGQQSRSFVVFDKFSRTVL